MPGLTPQQERELIHDLTALDWVRDLDGRSSQLIGDRLGCSAEEASLILQGFEAKKMIARISESAGKPTADRPLDSYGWKWIRKGTDAGR